jgi:uncharacterized membrane protein
MTENIRSYNHIAGQKVNRIEALSDGVFAIAMTLLVLDIRVPVSESIRAESDLWQLFFSLTPSLLSYFLSFLTLGIFWTGQTVQFNYIVRSDRHLNWLAIFFLMFVSLLPFTTSFLSRHIEFRLSIGIYWLNIVAMGFILLLHWNYAVRMGYLNIEGDEKVRIHRFIRKRILTAQSLYALSALLSFINTYLSISLIILIQLHYALALFHRQKK